MQKPMRKKTAWFILPIFTLVLILAAVFIYKELNPPMPPVTLDFEQKVLTPATATAEQAKRWAKKNGANSKMVELADTYWSLGEETGVNPVIAYAQAGVETNFFNFGGVLDATYNNPCGLKTNDGGEDADPNAHQRFTDWNEGIRAQYEHLALYAGKEGYPLENPVDPRHFPYLYGEAVTVGDLGDRWASSQHYSRVLAELIDRIEATPK